MSFASQMGDQATCLGTCRLIMAFRVRIKQRMLIKDAREELDHRMPEMACESDVLNLCWKYPRRRTSIPPGLPLQIFY